MLPLPATSRAAARQPLLDERGAAAVEHTVASLVFLFILFTGLEFLYLGYIALAGQFAINETIHWAAVGDALPGLTREQAIEEKFAEHAQSLGLHVEKEKLRICPIYDAGCTTDNAGSANDLVLISYRYPAEVTLLSAKFEVLLAAAARNEPF